MTKADLVANLSNATSLPKADVERLLDALGRGAEIELKKGGELPLPGIGKLKVVHTQARTARNPATGASIEVPAGRKVKLVVSKDLKEALAS